MNPKPPAFYGYSMRLTNRLQVGGETSPVATTMGPCKRASRVPGITTFWKT